MLRKFTCSVSDFSDKSIFGPQLQSHSFVTNTHPNDDLGRLKFFFSASLSFTEYEPDLASFCNRNQGPQWARMDLIAIMYEKGQCQLDEAWGNIFCNQVIFSQLWSDGSEDAIIPTYFGGSSVWLLSGLLPVPMFSTKSEVLLGFVATNADKTKALIDLFEGRQPEYTPFDFTPALYCTVPFADLWKRYYSSPDVSPDKCLERMRHIEYQQSP